MISLCCEFTCTDAVTVAAFTITDAGAVINGNQELVSAARDTVYDTDAERMFSASTAYTDIDNDAIAGALSTCVDAVYSNVNVKPTDDNGRGSVSIDTIVLPNESYSTTAKPTPPVVVVADDTGNTGKYTALGAVPTGDDNVTVAFAIDAANVIAPGLNDKPCTADTVIVGVQSRLEDSLIAYVTACVVRFIARARHVTDSVGDTAGALIGDIGAV